ncbi:hypothetical protein D1835_01285 [Enterococcus asini]|nr:hypothetical protein [Enterococcus asini]
MFKKIFCRTGIFMAGTKRETVDRRTRRTMAVADR